MKKFQRIASLLIALAILFAPCASYAVSGFSDLNEFHAWAEPQIEEMTTLGIIKGYTDGTFRPDSPITKTEALVLVARAAGYIADGYSEFTGAAYQRYMSFINTYNTPYPNEVAYILLKGILTESEITGYISSERASAPLLRHEMAFLLTRLMRADDTLASNADIKLSYADSGDIPYESVPYVDYVTQVSLMQGVYDPERPNETYFKPFSSVTRAQMAVLLYRILDKVKISVEYASYVGKNASTGTITYKIDDRTAIFKLSGNVNLTVDGWRTTSVAPVAYGSKIAFFSINGVLCDVDVVNDASMRYNGAISGGAEGPMAPVSGVISAINLSEDVTITIGDTSYLVLPTARITIDSKTATVYDLRVGQNVYIEFASGSAVLVQASDDVLPSDPNSLTCDGTIESVNYTAGTISIYLSASGDLRKIYLDEDAGIIDHETGLMLDIEDLEEDMRISALGSLSDGQFYASRIIVNIE